MKDMVIEKSKVNDILAKKEIVYGSMFGESASSSHYVLNENCFASELQVDKKKNFVCMYKSEEFGEEFLAFITPDVEKGKELMEFYNDHYKINSTLAVCAMAEKTGSIEEALALEHFLFSYKFVRVA